MNWSKDISKIALTLGADTVLRGGKVIVIDDEDTVAEAVAIKYGRIAFVGSDEESGKFVQDNTKMIDLEGKCVTPGLITTHEHFLRYGLNALFGIDLWYPKVKSITLAFSRDTTD